MSYYRIIRRNAPPPVPWGPNALGSALEVWLDASDASTLRAGLTVGSSASTGGGAVRMWVNRANTANGMWGYDHWWNATRQTSQVNGLDVVRLASQGNYPIYGPGDGSARVRPLPASISGLTIMIVKKTPATLVTSAEGVTVILSGGVDNGFAGLHIRNINNEGFKAYWHIALPNSGNLNASPKTKNTISASTTYLMVGRYEGSVSTALYLNGTLQETVSNPAASLSLQATIDDQIQIGTGWGGANGSVGDNCEILLCDSALSTSDRQKAEGYLAHKWGLTSSLPNDHPYKTSEPTV